jgi:hypothetical protein
LIAPSDQIVTTTSMPMTIDATEKRATGRPGDSSGAWLAPAARDGPSARGKSSTAGGGVGTALAALDRDQVSRIVVFSASAASSASRLPHEIAPGAMRLSSISTDLAPT